MSIPSQYPDFQTWFNKPVGDLSDANASFMFFKRLWPYLTAAQKTQARNVIKDTIDEAIVELQNIKTELSNQ